MWSVQLYGVGGSPNMMTRDFLSWPVYLNAIQVLN